MILCSSLFVSAQVIKSVHLTAAGNLANDLTAQGVDNTVTDLTVTTDAGVYMTNTEDFKTLNNLPNLLHLDMSGAYTAATATGTLPASAFYNNTHLQTFIFPANVKNIGANALTGCTGLTGPLTIPGTVNGTANLKGRMDNMPGVTEFIIGSGSSTLKAIDGVIYSMDGTILALYPGGKTATSYNIASGTTTVYDGAFAYVQNLTTLNIPSSVTAFGTASNGTTTFYVNKCCFYSPSLQTITVDAGNANFTSMNGILVDKTSGWNYIREFPENYQPQELTVDGSIVQTIQGNIFSRAKNLRYVKFGEGVTALKYQTFKYNGVTPAILYVELPTTLTSLGNEVFNGATSLKQIVFKSSTPPTVGTNAFGSVSNQSDVLVGVPESNLAAYQATGTGTLITTGGFTAAKIVAYRNITLGAKVSCTPAFQTLGIPTKDVSITASTPDPGYMFSSWTATPTLTFTDSNNPITTFVMPDNDVTIHANYTLSPTTGLNENYDKQLEVYPNPTKDCVNLIGASGTSYDIYDMTGKLVLSGKKYNNTPISIKELNNGLYILKSDSKTVMFIKK